MLFAMIVFLGFLTLVVAQLTQNGKTSELGLENSAKLGELKMALQGWSMRQATPGILPCPDITGDGYANTAGGTCNRQLGLLPYRTIGTSAGFDAAGSRMWYAVDLDVRSNSGAVMNPSLDATMTLDGDVVVAVIISPGVGATGVPGDIAGNLEGINADADCINTVFIVWGGERNIGGRSMLARSTNCCSHLTRIAQTIVNQQIQGGRRLSWDLTHAQLCTDQSTTHRSRRNSSTPIPWIDRKGSCTLISWISRHKSSGSKMLSKIIILIVTILSNIRPLPTSCL